MTVEPRERLPTIRGRKTQDAIDAAARTVIARKGIPATTISDIAAETGRSRASLHYYCGLARTIYRKGTNDFQGTYHHTGTNDFQGETER